MERKREEKMTKDVLIGIFVRKDKILSFLEFLKGKIKINLEKIFVYLLEENSNEYLVTFKTNNKKKYLQEIHYSTVMHVKNGCIFSINALNKYIEEINGNTDKNFMVNWDGLRNKLIVLNKGELNISNIRKIEDKSEFFK